jgi:hypothetical protein
LGIVLIAENDPTRNLWIFKKLANSLRFLI